MLVYNETNQNNDTNQNKVQGEIYLPTGKYNLIIGAIFLVAAALSRLPSFFTSVYDWDESLYFMMAEQWRAGHLPYIALWDNKPVGIYAIFTVFQDIFGDRLFAMRIAVVIFVAATAFVIFKIAGTMRYHDKRLLNRSGLLAGLAFILCSISNDGLAANTELFMITFTSLAVLCAVHPIHFKNTPARRGFLTGLLLGISLMIKFVVIFEIPAILFALLFLHRAVTPRQIAAILLACLAGGLLPALLTVLLYFYSGHLDQLIYSDIGANFLRESVGFRLVFSDIAAKILKWFPLYCAAFIMVFSLAFAILKAPQNTFQDTGRRFQEFLVLWLLGAALGIISGKSFYSHYFIQILPPLCICLAWAIIAFAQGMNSRSFRVAGALLCSIFLIPAMSAAITIWISLHAIMTVQGGKISFHADASQQIADDISRVDPGHSAKLYVFDYEPIIYVLADAVPPTRFAYPPFLTTCLLARVAGVQPQDELNRILATNPEFIVQATTPMSGLAIDQAVYADFQYTVSRRYAVWKRYEPAIVYKLRQGALATTNPLDAKDPCTS